MSEKFCLKWNDFQANTFSSFQDLRHENEYADVALNCEGDRNIQAHKFILAAASPVFQNILKQNKHPHPVIYMRGTKFQELEAILDFLYQGEANINQGDLETFLALAEELQLKGLTGSFTGNETIERYNILEKGDSVETKKSKNLEKNNDMTRLWLVDQ